MIQFFGDAATKVFVVQCSQTLSPENREKLSWLFGEAPLLEQKQIEGFFLWTARNHDYPLEYQCS